MLASKQGGRTNQSHLPARHGHDEGCTQRDLGLAKTDIAADQAIHRFSSFEVLKDVGNGMVLIVRFLIGEAVDESRVAGVRLGNDAGARGAKRSDLDEFARDLTDPLLHSRLAPLPGLAAEAVQSDAFALAPVAA